MQIYLFQILNIYTFFVFRNVLKVRFFKKNSDSESGESIVVVNCTLNQCSRVGAVSVNNLHLVTC